jgi:predicted RNase H-like nuclease (RuvC/YqgF family)
MRRQSGKPVVGFYKDRRGETRPITKSVAELNRKKVIQGGQRFKGVSPEAQKRQIENARRQLQRLEGELQNTDREVGKLNESSERLKSEVQKAHYEGNESKEKSLQKSLRQVAFTLQSKMRHKRAVEQQAAKLKRICS